MITLLSEWGNSMNHELDVKAAVKDTLPTVFGYIGIGIAFGVIGHAAGISTLLVALISIIIYAGSAQFITVSMLATGAPIFSIIIATFLVNSRMILMSASLAPYFKKYSILKNIQIGTLLTDESFALGMNKINHTNNRLNFEWFNTANIIAYVTWIVSSVIGAQLGNLIGDPKTWGLDFAIIAMFFGLLYLQVIADRKFSFTLQITVIALTILLTYFGMIFLPKTLVIIAVTLIGCGLGVMIKHAFF